MNHAVSDRREVVEQADGDPVQCARQRIGREFPWDVGGVGAAVDYRTGHAEACGIHRGARAKKFGADRFEALEIRSRIAMLAHEFESSRGMLEESEFSFGSADIASQDESIHGNLAGSAFDV